MPKQRGFSLVELIVVVAIFIVLTSVILFNQNKFSSDVAVGNLAYDIALQIRKAQVYGLLVREDMSSGGGFNNGYGINFMTRSDGEIYFILFTDVNNNGVFDSSIDETISTFNIEQGNTIADICTDSSTDPERCFSSNGGLNITYASIVFKRPDPDAIIRDSRNSTRKSQIEITVNSALGDTTKYISVLNTGQISVR